MYAEQTMNESSFKRINHENFHSNENDYRSRVMDDTKVAGGVTVGVIDQDTTTQNTVGNVNTEPISDAMNIKYDESALSRCALLFIGSLCQQGSSESPQFTSRRCIIILILLFGFSMYQFYSASIVGSLLMEKPKTIKTLRDLIDSPLKLGMEDIPYSRDFFRRSTEEIVQELYNRKVKVVNPKTGEITYNWLQIRDGMGKVKQGGFAFHADTASFYKIITDEFSERSVCELCEIPLFPEQHMMTIVQKGSPLRKMITYGLRRLAEHGIMYYERKRWHASQPQCVRRIQPEDLAVSIETIGSAFYVLLLGIFMSFILLLVEIAIWSYFTYKKRKQMHTITYLK